jgi:NAD(P)H-flavin reductase
MQIKAGQFYNLLIKNTYRIPITSRKIPPNNGSIVLGAEYTTYIRFT